jgi:tRNA A-37 threonylcarbamoyl transferase component Bud32
MKSASGENETAPGTVLGGRFEVHGVLGRGGTATVLLATDRLRGERIALKLVHPHLASDPATRRRLRREVQTASVLRSDAALVPHDLHELDGALALSMPYHRGQTLLERVATRGPLPPEEVRVLGIRLAGALADAHRAGVLHRDVTSGNVLIGEEASGAVLTDFGLARLVQGGTRSTGLLGTAGYAAPEIYEGARADPRSDLYGLGAVLYLAATGKAPFDARVPMAALKQQLDGSFPPVRSAAPQVPADLAALIERLLSPSPAGRPATAREVADRLLQPGPIPAAAPAASGVSAAAGARPRPRIAGRFLPEGRYTVLVREHEDDRHRRNQLRSRRAQRNVPDELARWGWHLADRVRDALGVPLGPVLTPEERLVGSLADEMAVPPEVLLESPVMRRRKFRLVDSTDHATAERLAEAAREAGFRAQVIELGEESERWRSLWAVYMVMMAVGWSTFPFLLDVFGMVYLWLMIGLSAGWPVLAQTLSGSQRNVREIAVAYRSDLLDAVKPGTALTPRFVAPSHREGAGKVLAEPTPSPEPAGPEPAGRRVEAALDKLDQVLEQVDLPEVARRDLAATSRELRQRARKLAQDVERLGAELESDQGAEEELSALSARLDRLETLARAGEVANQAERERLARAIAVHEASRRAADQVESEWVAATAQLLEIASTAAQIRRELLLEPERHSADQWVERLTRDANAANDARREAARQQARRLRE